MLDWAELDPEKLERVAQLLVREACGATSVDGKGGDLAQDLRHDGPDGLTIYEVKSFTKRLNNSRQRQITKSLARAVELHAPRRWVLVIPLNPTPAELAWFDGLRGKFPDVELDWYGLDWLDGQIAGRDGLLSYVEGADSKLLRRAQQYNMERAALTSGADLTQRMQDLVELGATISPYWKWHFGDTPWGPGRILTAQRPEAADDDPVQLTPYFSFPPDDPEAQATAERLDRALRLGGDVDIPGRYVEDFRVTAASEATQRLLGEPRQQVAQLRLISIPDNTGLPLRGFLVLERGGGQSGLSVPFTFTDGVAGTHGRTLTGTDPSGLLEARLEIEAGDPVRGRMELNLKPLAGSYPHDVLPAVRLLGVCTAGDSLHFRRGPVTIASFNADAPAPEGLPGLHHLVAALEVLQDHLGTLIPVPAGPVPDEDFRELLAIARALSGRRARLPHTGLSMDLQPGAIGEFLTKVPEEPGALYGTQHSIDITLDGRRYDVPGLALWAPNVVLQNRAELEVLSADARAEAVATFSSPEDTGIFLIRAVDDPGPAYRRVVEMT
ncbi:hypothetical protein [Blastococcus montanus]|uniref:hypothetical protein n=1 Tax=Blastococcus montanus TaxID=3144973 RepID=UPI00320B90AA